MKKGMSFFSLSWVHGYNELLKVATQRRRAYLLSRKKKFELRDNNDNNKQTNKEKRKEK